MAGKIRKIRLGDLLLENKKITPEQLERALAEQKKLGAKLGNVLIHLNYIDEKALLNFLSQQLNIPFVDLKHFMIDPAVTRLLPEIYARRFRAILLGDKPDGFLVGMADPLDIYAYDELARILKKPIQLAIVQEADLLETLDATYRNIEENIQSLGKQLSEELQTTDIDIERLAENIDVADAPVVKLLQSIFKDAIQIRASDIHIEPDENVLRIRQRVDGQLQEHITKDVRIAPAVAQRLKLLAKLNITEKRLPQDGRFSLKIQDKIVDIRLSTMPTQYGESVVMRLLVRSDAIATFKQLGMPTSLIQTLKRLIELPYGMILVTGPTGSGKTTTLYSILNEINNPAEKIITVEDPVEYRLARINQVQVNANIDLDFARVLRSALRQDPDIIMIGEIRDKETASIALRASITGHLVFATLHTNDAISSAVRLIDMGNEGYMVASALRAVLSQRLVRRICENCIEPHEPSAEEMAWLNSLKPPIKIEGKAFKQGRGCAKCNNTGYKGRLGVFELLIINDKMIVALTHEDTSLFTQLAETDTKFIPLQKAALSLAEQGVTTLHEAINIALESEDISRMVQGG